MGDGDLIRRAGAGDEVAARELYARHAPRVRRQVERSLGDRDPGAVDDLCQEIWINAFRGLGRFRGDARFSTWLHTIARRQLISWSRSRARRLPGTFDDETTAAGRGDPVTLRIDLERALRGLPPRMKEVVWLHDVQGFTHEQIGSQLDIHPGTSRSQLFRARARLRESLRAEPVAAGAAA